MKTISNLVLSTLTAALLIGCGGGGGSSAGTANPTATTTTGTFIDDKVSGVKYVNGSNTGFTDPNGQFPYTSGVISFYIGNIKLGEMSSLPSDNKVFVQDVVGVDRSITTNAKVLKIASILQSLDSDTTTDAIEIKEEDFNKFNDVSTIIDENTNVSTILTSKIPSITVKTQEDIQRHLENSLKQYTDVSSNSNPLTLTTSSITTGSVNVSKDASIVLTFSNDIKKSSINKDNIVLKDASNSLVDFTITQEFNRVTLKPLSLSYSTSYTLTLKSTIEDYSKNSLGSTDIVITFITQSQPDTSSPVFTSNATVNVSENQTSALTVKATDDSAVTYSLSGDDASAFDINSSSGVITFKIAPDYETKSSYSMVVTAKDTSNNSRTQNVIVNITNVDETIPDITAPTITSASSFSVNENQIGAFTAVATDDRGNVTYSLSGTDSSAFDINSSTGVVTFKVAPDYETKTSYSVTVVATDNSNNTSTKDVVVNINNLDDITFNNITYGIVTSPYTNRQWLDRNLGATQVCSKAKVNFSTFSEYETDQGTCFGDYYQWGRGTDGHEKKDSLVTDQDKVIDLNNPHNKFVSYVYDWASTDENGSIRKTNWSKTDGSSVCPVGFRVPTLQELSNETINNGVNNETTAFNNFLKLPSSGAKITGWGGSRTEFGRIWTINDNGTPTGYNSYLYFNGSSAYIRSDYYRANGLSVRCIKDIPDAIAPTITSASSFSVDENQTGAFTIVATDDSVISYSLNGTDASSFNIDSTTGVVTFKVAPDYETKTSYSLTVKAIDSSSNLSTLAVTVNITDVSEVVYDITFNGVGYNIITSPITGKRWLDRNLGASQACTSSTNSACYGDYYQWGRLADGHEKSTSTSISTQGTTISNVGNQFIFGFEDWTTADGDGSQRMAQWNKTDGTGVCPIGFKVPTMTELANETIDYNGINDLNLGAVKVTNSTTALQNFLKFPLSGHRKNFDSGMSYLGIWNNTWSNTVLAPHSMELSFYVASASSGSLYRANGFSVRCIEGN